MRAYLRAVDDTSPLNVVHAAESAAVPGVVHSARQRRRQLPSPAEQARRVAWGRKYGPMVGQMIRQSIARTGN